MRWLLDQKAQKQSPTRQVKVEAHFRYDNCSHYSPSRNDFFLCTTFQNTWQPNDRQLFHYFCVHTASDLAEFSYGSENFWGRRVMEYSYHKPVVRSALIAVASIHRNFATEYDESVRRTEPLAEYNKAIRRLRYYMKAQISPDKKVVLVW